MWQGWTAGIHEEYFGNHVNFCLSSWWWYCTSVHPWWNSSNYTVNIMKLEELLKVTSEASGFTWPSYLLSPKKYPQQRKTSIYWELKFGTPATKKSNKQAGTTIFIFDKIHFKPKLLKRNTEGHIYWQKEQFIKRMSLL